jgi:hypothetical protein
VKGKDGRRERGRGDQAVGDEVDKGLGGENAANRLMSGRMWKAQTTAYFALLPSIFCLNVLVCLGA